MRFERTGLQEAIRGLEAAHERFVGHLKTLHDTDLAAKARQFFLQAPRNDDRLPRSLIWDVTGGRFAEHLSSIRERVGRDA